MGLFGFKKKNTPPITDADREWVENSFSWLIQVFGYPKHAQQILLTKEYFPNTFSIDHLKIQNLLDDLSYLLGIDSGKITFELHKDSRDIYGMPFGIEGIPFETETEVTEDNYKIHIANSIAERPNRLAFNLIHEFIKIHLIRNKLKYDTGEDTNLFITIGAIYFGFGIPIAQNLTDKGTSNDGAWETNWNYTTGIPDEVIAFALATFSKITEHDNPEWKNKLSKDLKPKFENSITFINSTPLVDFIKVELEANDLFNQAEQETYSNDHQSAISTLQKVLTITENEILKMHTYNNIGYCQTRIGKYEESIINYEQALQIDSNFGFAYDNLGYSLIQIRRLEKGKENLEKAGQTDNNDIAYTYRNFALYHLAKKEIDKAKAHFLLAFENVTSPVDLLEFHYANFLIEQDETEEGMRYLNIAIEKGEPEAIKRMKELNT